MGTSQDNQQASDLFGTDEVVAQLEANNELLSEIVDQLGGEQPDPTPDGQRLRELPFSLGAEVPNDTDANDPIETKFDAPYDAVISTVFIGWPSGAQQAVGVQLGTGTGTVWVPRGGQTYLDDDDEPDDNPEYISEDNVTLSFDLNVEIDEGEPVTARFISNDPDENHFITVIPILREREGGD